MCCTWLVASYIVNYSCILYRVDYSTAAAHAGTNKYDPCPLIYLLIYLSFTRRVPLPPCTSVLCLYSLPLFFASILYLIPIGASSVGDASCALRTQQNEAVAESKVAAFHAGVAAEAAEVARRATEDDEEERRTRGAWGYLENSTIHIIV